MVDIWGQWYLGKAINNMRRASARLCRTIWYVHLHVFVPEISKQEYAASGSPYCSKSSYFFKISSCSFLYHFNFIYVGLGIWTPYRGVILDLESDQSIVSSLSYALLFGAGISSYDAKSPIHIGGHILGSGIWIFHVASLLISTVCEDSWLYTKVAVITKYHFQLPSSWNHDGSNCG